MAFIFAVSVSVNSNAQRYVENNRIIDTLEILKSKKLLNDLNTDNFKRKVHTGIKSAIPYRLLSPKEVIPGKKYPLVITFHNSSRIGNDNQNQLKPLARIWIRDEIYRNFNCFVIAPQFNKRSSDYVKGDDDILKSLPSNDVHEILKLIDETEKNYPVDRRRIFLIGYSMGASTAQNLFSLRPEKFAALISIAGVADFSNIEKLKRKKIWLIHGKQDIDNPYMVSEELYRKLAGNKKLIFSSYKNLDHNNIMVPFLLTEDIPKWLFEADK
ncbi:Phospholipase/Carboxylesterase [Chryseobacterium soldanellicola]|uniref:Phospholipase/Carboxylesterase n=1 Tax=Chryseobacterium soldanellicola TaxID=311333 RepID=A0A1H1FUB8_9FLAO|nr:Phospholipase/Carboxylesterase [Chryseobacterium soldanellicola]